jgi:hypothetical protein
LIEQRCTLVTKYLQAPEQIGVAAFIESAIEKDVRGSENRRTVNIVLSLVICLIPDTNRPESAITVERRHNPLFGHCPA